MASSLVSTVSPKAKRDLSQALNQFKDKVIVSPTDPHTDPLHDLSAVIGQASLNIGKTMASPPSEPDITPPDLDNCIS